MKWGKKFSLAFHSIKLLTCMFLSLNQIITEKLQDPPVLWMVIEVRAETFEEFFSNDENKGTLQIIS